MSITYESIIYFLIFAGISLYGTIFFSLMFFDKRAMNWDIIKPFVEGELKKKLMQYHSFSEDEYMQSIVSVWVIVNIPAEDVKKLIKISENSAKERETAKKIISKVKQMQKEIRLLFVSPNNLWRVTWKIPYLSSLVKLLKDASLSVPLNIVEHSVANAFYKKHENAAGVLKRKINNNDFTFVENAIKYVPTAFNQTLKSTN